MNIRFSAALVTMALAASAATAQTPLGTAITYQDGTSTELSRL